MAGGVIKVIFRLSCGRDMTVEHAGVTQNLMTLARQHSVPGIDGICGGLMACATCHVHVEPEWRDAVGAASRDEREIIEMTATPKPESRLGCQIRVTRDLDGLRVAVASR